MLSLSVGRGVITRTSEVRTTLAAIAAQRAEFARSLLLRAVKPFASLKSPRLGSGAVFLSGLMLATLTTESRQVARDFRAAFGVGRLKSLLMTVHWNAARPWEVFSEQRMIGGQAQAATVQLRHQNDASVREWLAQGRSFILALSSFERDEVLYSSLNERAISHPIEFLVAPPPPVRTLSPRMRRISLQYHQILKALKAYRPVGLETSTVGANVGVPLSTIKRLRAGGHVVGLMVDAPWAPGSPSAHERPFAGWRRRTFATGVGAMSRIAQCPVVLCLPERQADGSILLKWSDPIEPPARDDRAGDHAVVDRLLDLVEREIGRRPTHYLVPVGGERLWSPATARWTAPPHRS